MDITKLSELRSVLSLYSMEGNKDDSNTEENNEFKDHILVKTVLSFTTYGLDTSSDINVNMILGETFCSEEIDTARDIFGRRVMRDTYLRRRTVMLQTDELVNKLRYMTF